MSECQHLNFRDTLDGGECIDCGADYADATHCNECDAPIVSGSALCDDCDTKYLAEWESQRQAAHKADGCTPDHMWGGHRPLCKVCGNPA